MSCYVAHTKAAWAELCPFHGCRFKKKQASLKARFWHCPFYADCGYSIGARPLVGHVTEMWIRQSRKGRAFVKRHTDRIRGCTEQLEPDEARDCGILAP